VAETVTKDKFLALLEAVSDLMFVLAYSDVLDVAERVQLEKKLDRIRHG
jgi:hypothetical protein